MRCESASNSTNVGNYNNPTSCGEIKNLKKRKEFFFFFSRIVVQLRGSPHGNSAVEKWMRGREEKKVGGGRVLALTCSSEAVRLLDSGSTGLLLLGVNVCKKRQYNQEQNWTCANPTAVHHGSGEHDWLRRRDLFVWLLGSCELDQLIVVTGKPKKTKEKKLIGCRWITPWDEKQAFTEP